MPRLPRLLIAGLAMLVLAAPAAAGTREPRVVGGTDAGPGEAPWQVYLDMQGGYCGGTLVAPQYVLTADHCGAQPGDEIRANSLSRTSGGDVIAVDAVARHPLADQAGVPRFDVNMLRLAEPVPNAEPLAIVGTGEADLWEAGDALLVSGWGHTESGGTPSETLQVAEVPRRSDADCLADYPGKFDAADMFCAAPPAGGVDTCQGDSGGPIAAPTEPNADRTDASKWRLVGATSWGDGCAGADAPGVYARLDAPEIRAWTSLEPLVPAEPVVTGTAAPGQVLTCDRAGWSGTAYFEYAFFRRHPDGTNARRIVEGPPQTFTVRPQDAGFVFTCEVHGFNGTGDEQSVRSAEVTVAGQAPPLDGGGSSGGGGGGGGGGSSDAPPAPAPAPPPALAPPAPGPPVVVPPAPRAAVIDAVTRRCSRITRRCTVVVDVLGPAPALSARLLSTARRPCRRGGRRATCRRTVNRRLRARPGEPGSFLVTTPRLRPGVHTLVLTPSGAAASRRVRLTVA